MKMGNKKLWVPTASFQDASVRLSFFTGTREYSRDKAYRPEISVFRMEANDFNFNYDRLEYFNGLGIQDAEVIFKGQIEPENDRKYIFMDESVTIGMTYAYWVSADGGEPTGPVAVKARDQGVWWPQARLDRHICALSKEYPSCAEVFECGRTARNHPIRALRVGNTRNAIALIGAIHPGEAGPEIILQVLSQLLATDQALLAQVGVAAIPSVNIDMRETLVTGYPHYIRKNANGVDLNRNFDADWAHINRGYGYYSNDPEGETYRGASPASENESVAVIHFLEVTRPCAVFSMHSLACICDDTFLCAATAQGDSAYHEACIQAAAPYTQGFSSAEEPILHYACSAGSLPAFAYQKYGIPCFDLEFHGDSSILQEDKTTPAMLADYTARHYRGVREVLRSLQHQGDLAPECRTG